MFGYRDPLRQMKCVGGNGMATLGKGIFWAIGGMFVLGVLGSTCGFGLLVVGLIALVMVKGKK